ncbi:MAG: TetR/AcrR family transcriptional regulator [Candidatus Cloacimonadota bacterium]|nr:TetR/AcrR family transcriptional regulator [Candidatus Cloacimonadota bacterium]
MGIVERKEREKELRSESIIDAAENVFFSKGFENATMLDVAKEVELSKGTIYLYFHSKNELCMAILLRGLHAVKNILKKLLNDNETSGIDKISRLADLFITFSKEHSFHYSALLSYREHRENCPASGKIITSTIDENKNINGIISDMIKIGQADETIKMNIDPEKLSLLIWGNFTGIMPSIILNETSTVELNFDPENILKYHFQLITNAIRTEGA